MIGALIILAVLLGLLLWVVIRTLRVPRKSEHERTHRLPGSDAHIPRGPQSGG